jgi:hypothetical protein
MPYLTIAYARRTGGSPVIPRIGTLVKAAGAALLEVAAHRQGLGRASEMSLHSSLMIRSPSTEKATTPRRHTGRAKNASLQALSARGEVGTDDCAAGRSTAAAAPRSATFIGRDRLPQDGVDDRTRLALNCRYPKLRKLPWPSRPAIRESCTAIPMTFSARSSWAFGSRASWIRWLTGAAPKDDCQRQ